ncbi:hypothetical protein ACH5RR_019653 [Cinchona calisaya]|uniref:Uncharacterized protein n=1 Tax=Cinchona calisaya TaxID=153742 RepID=A0ABD2ZPZ4_9GENT
MGMGMGMGSINKSADVSFKFPRMLLILLFLAHLVLQTQFAESQQDPAVVCPRALANLNYKQCHMTAFAPLFKLLLAFHLGATSPSSIVLQQTELDGAAVVDRDPRIKYCQGSPPLNN